MVHAQRFTLLLALLVAGAPSGGASAAAQGEAARAIPGINAKDAYPNGCVDCHSGGPKGEARMSDLLAKWASVVPEPLLEKTRAASDDPAKIKGKHMPVAGAKTNNPQSCLTLCHKAESKIAPPFARLMHTIHLVGDGQNRFLTAYQGECTHCHKLDPQTGRWKIPSAAEK